MHNSVHKVLGTVHSGQYLKLRELIITCTCSTLSHSVLLIVLAIFVAY